MGIYNIPRKPTGRIVRPGGLITSNLRSLGGIVVPGGAGFWSIDARSGGQWLEHSLVEPASRDLSSAVVGIVGSGGALPTGWVLDGGTQCEIISADADKIVLDVSFDNSGGGGTAFPGFRIPISEPGSDAEHTVRFFGHVSSMTNIATDLVTIQLTGGQNLQLGDLVTEAAPRDIALTGNTHPNNVFWQFFGRVAAGLVGSFQIEISGPRFYRSDFGGMIGAGSFNLDVPEYPAILDKLAQNPDGSGPVTEDGQPVGNVKPIAGDAEWTSSGNDRPTLDISARLLDFSAGGKVMQTALTERTDQMWLAALVNETGASFTLWGQGGGNTSYVGFCASGSTRPDNNAGPATYYVNGDPVGATTGDLLAAIRNQGLVWVEAFCDLRDGTWAAGIDFGRLAFVNELSGTGLGAYAGRDPGATARSNIAMYIQQQYPELPSWAAVLPA